jgi:hypothetical protein
VADKNYEAAMRAIRRAQKKNPDARGRAAGKAVLKEMRVEKRKMDAQPAKRRGGKPSTGSR